MGFYMTSGNLKQTLIVATLITSLNKKLRKFVKNEGYSVSHSLIAPSKELYSKMALDEEGVSPL